MNNLINFLKENYKVIIGTILIYQVILTIFFFSIENLILLSIFVLVVASYIIIMNFKDDFLNFFKK